MSDYSFPCPNCSQNISVPQDQAGGTMRCPTCKQEFTAPKPQAGPQPPPLPSRTKSGFSSAVPPVIAASTGSMPPPLPGAATARPGLGAVGGLEREVLEGGRFVVFQYCFSVLIMSFKRSSPVMFLRGNEDGAREALSYSLISLVAGWWGIPWGPIWTIATVSTNLSGGKDLSQAILTEKLGPARAAQIMAQRKRPSLKGGGLRKVQWGFAAAGVALALLVAALVFSAAVSDQKGSRHPWHPGEAQFREANRQLETYRGSVAFGNTPKAVSVATRFSSDMKTLRSIMFEGGKQEGLSVSHHEFLTCCELQETQCVLIVHVPELRRFTESAKTSLGTLAWLTAQEALQKEQAAKTGMRLAVGLRGIVLYDRVILGTLVSDGSSATNGLLENVTGPHPEERLFPWFEAAEAPALPSGR
jgi:hypothetical protein